MDKLKKEVEPTDESLMRVFLLTRLMVLVFVGIPLLMMVASSAAIELVSTAAKAKTVNTPSVLQSIVISPAENECAECHSQHHSKKPSFKVCVLGDPDYAAITTIQTVRIPIEEFSTNWKR